MAYRYPTVKVNGKTKLKHRHVMEQHLGRPLLPTEQVHHKAGRFECEPPAGEVKDRQWGCASRPRAGRDLVGDKIRWERKL